MAQREQANVPLLLTIGGVSGILIIVLAIGLQAWYLREVQQEVAAKWDNVPIQPLADRRAEQWQRITTYHWVDKDKQRAAIPISEAMKIVAGAAATQPSAKID
jgi:hypothetical protein